MLQQQQQAASKAKAVNRKLPAWQQNTFTDKAFYYFYLILSPRRRWKNVSPTLRDAPMRSAAVSLDTRILYILINCALSPGWPVASRYLWPWITSGGCCAGWLDVYLSLKTTQVVINVVQVCPLAGCLAAPAWLDFFFFGGELTLAAN